MRFELEPPSYADCTPLPPTLTLDLKDTKIYTPCSNHDRKKNIVHYRISSNLNREFVKGGFGLSRTHPWKSSESMEVYDIRAIGDSRFILKDFSGGVVTVQRKFGFSGHSWEVKRLFGSDMRQVRSEIVLTAKKTSKEDSTLRWCDGNGQLVATDTKLFRERGNHENCFRMPVLSLVAELEQEMLDLLVAAWLARVWVEVVQAKKKTLMDGAYL